MRPVINLLHLRDKTIFEQLQIEEALLRLDHRNWCIVQDGVDPAIVMGISGKPDENLNQDLLRQRPVPVIKRFSGGGTVFVDRNTAFITFICQSAELNVAPCPDKVFCWSDTIYRQIFYDLPYSLKERDYTIYDRKFGGNAQYMRKDRWLHHTTLLWEYDPANMDYLLLPSRRPKYRLDRDHKDFICTLSDYLPAREHLFARLTMLLGHKFDLKVVSDQDFSSLLQQPHRRSTEMLI